MFERAIAFAQAHETPWSRKADSTDFGIYRLDPPPWNRLLGPLHDRGPICGIVRVGGRERARFGDVNRPDLTFSVAKTCLALLAGVAHDRGLLPDPDEPVGRRVPGIGFDDGPNAQVTWTHLLQQTSEWRGECFGVSDQVDHNRFVQYQHTKPAGRKGEARPLHASGTFWEYNDVRINQLSLALLHLFGQPLPEVFDEAFMRPVGASADWRWEGYDNSWVTIEGRRMQSVPGGSHWGGGLSISAADQALLGQMLADDGVVQQRRWLSREWIERMRTPCPLAPFYGMLVWLNGTQDVFPSAGGRGFFAVGAGTSLIWVDPERSVVAVVRWIDGAHADTFFGLIAQELDAS